MTIPVITYPAELDTETNLYVVADALSIALAKDYNPGDDTIYVAADLNMMLRFPDSGIITLTENCSVPENRALSFYYSSKNNVTFSFTGLTILPETPDTFKKSVVTKVTMNVTAQHHNNIKDAIVNIETFVGKESDRTVVPFAGNIVERTNYLFSTVFTPRAWFVSTSTRGIVPLAVVFESKSFYVGEDIQGNQIQYTWTIFQGIPPNDTVISINPTYSPIFTYTFQDPGIYGVALSVTNFYGSDTVIFVNYIDCLYDVPFEAIIDLPAAAGQKDFSTGGNNFLKAPANSYVNVLTSNLPVPLASEPRTFAGAHLDASDAQIDPITTFTWDLSDNLTHANSPETKALYSIGGIYSVVLRCDTESNAYRITTNAKTINVIERQNAWLFTFIGSSSTNVAASELGFLNESFKPQQKTAYAVTRNTSFIVDRIWDESSGYIVTPEDKQRMLLEFKRNTNLNVQANVPSGYQGLAVLSWASGRDLAQSPSLETINYALYSGFDESYSTSALPTTNRPWNWITLNSTGSTFFLLGNSTAQSPNTSPVNLNLIQANYLLNTIVPVKTFSPGDFIAASSYLTFNAAVYNGAGYNIYGDYSAYRYAARGRYLYILKNLGVGQEFRINSFYSSSEGVSGILTGFKKLPDMTGPLVTQGVLLNLATGLFFFNNTGSVMYFDTVTNVWKIGGPGYNSIAFSKIQDTSVPDYGNENNGLVASTDFSNNAFLSFDYSSNAFCKFNDIDLSFTKLNSRAAGEQWIFGSY